MDGVAGSPLRQLLFVSFLLLVMLALLVGGVVALRRRLSPRQRRKKSKAREEIERILGDREADA